MSALLRALGLRAVRFVHHLGALAGFALQILVAGLRPPLRLRRLADAVYDVGVLSLAVILLSGLTVGAVMGLQSYQALVTFGAESAVGALVGVAFVREFGPVITALLVTGRAASATAAEIASMVTTEQLDGLRMMSIDPVDFVVVPKAGAMLIAMPLLNALFIAFAFFGAYLIAVVNLGSDGGTFLSSLEGAVELRHDIGVCFLKAGIFGALVGLLATYLGYHSEPTSAGVSRATTSTVVIGSVSILVADYAITALWGF